VAGTVTRLGTTVAVSGSMSNSALSLLWWVAIGLLLFWLMRRGGCGMMGHHREHDRPNGGASRSSTGKPIDPVCGMEVDPEKAAGTQVVMGETYFLCSQTCLDAFDKDSAMYAHPREQRSAHHHQHA
jgi:Cu+-exporting ATPase